MFFTNLQSYIADTNGSFISASDFSADDLIARPHHVARHSDMPNQVFANMGQPLKSREAWTVRVKIVIRTTILLATGNTGLIARITKRAVIYQSVISQTEETAPNSRSIL